MHAIRSQLIVICLLAGLGAVQLSRAQPGLPDRGLDRSVVETRFGAPQRIEGPVGTPPITKWIYADFIVVFEYDHVIHAVKRQPVVEQGPTGDAATSPEPATSATPASVIPQAMQSAPASPGDETIAGPAESGITPDSDPADSTDRQTTGDTLNLPQ